MPPVRPGMPLLPAGYGASASSPAQAHALAGLHDPTRAASASIAQGMTEALTREGYGAAVGGQATGALGGSQAEAPPPPPGSILTHVCCVRM